MKKGNCQNCGCRFTFPESRIKTEEDIFGNKITFIRCPVCGHMIEPRYWTDCKKK